MIVPTYDSGLNKKLGGGLSGLVEIYGDEGTGKTGLALSLFQHQEGVFVDLDGTFPHHMVPVGSERNVSLFKPEKNILKSIIDVAGAVSRYGGIVVIDPVGVLTPTDIGKLVPELGCLGLADGALVVMINHCDAYGKSKGERYTTLYTSQRIELRGGVPWKKRGEVIGMKSEYKVTKNNLEPPQCKGSLNILFERGGVDEVAETV